VEKKDAEKNPEDGGEKGECGEPADRIFVDELKPYQISDKGDDDRLIEEGSDDIRTNLVNPSRLKDDTHDEQDGDREKKLVKEGVNRFNPLCHELLDVKGRGSPQEGCRDLQNISQEHGCLGCFGSTSEDDEDARKSQGETYHFWNGQPIPFKKEMGPNGYHKGAQIDKEHRASRIRIKQAEVDTGELGSK